MKKSNIRFAGEPVQLALKLLVAEQGEDHVAAQLGVSKPTLARLVAGFGVMPPVLTLVESRLRETGAIAA